MLSGAALQHIRAVIMHFVDAENDLPSIFYGYYCCVAYSTLILCYLWKYEIRK